MLYKKGINNRISLNKSISTFLYFFMYLCTADVLRSVGEGSRSQKNEDTAENRQ